MRKPLEDKVVTISRATDTLTFPANFVLVAAPPKYGGTQAAMIQLAISARAFHRILKLAQIIADVEGEQNRLCLTVPPVSTKICVMAPLISPFCVIVSAGRWQQALSQAGQQPA